EFGFALFRYRGGRGVLRVSGAGNSDVRDSVGSLGQPRTVESRVTGLVAVTAPHIRQTDLADGEVHRPQCLRVRRILPLCDRAVHVGRGHDPVDIALRVVERRQSRYPVLTRTEVAVPATQRVAGGERGIVDVLDVRSRLGRRAAGP